jgi:RNA polymerase sigma-70 factor (ECF subfamily)
LGIYSQKGRGAKLSDDLRQVVDRCLTGDQAAMIELVDRYRNMVFGFCYRMMGRRQDAEDAAQETFIRVLKSLAKWDSSREFKPWLMAIAANRCRTMLSARKRRPVPADIHDEQFVDDAADWQAAHQLAEEVNLALGEIRDEYRQAFALFHDQQMSYDEIAEALGCPLGTVKTWIYRARQHVTAWLLEREIVPSRSYDMRRV